MSLSFSRTRSPVDHVLLIVVCALAAFGLIMISSVSVYESYQAYTADGVDCSLDGVNCNDFYFARQMRNLLVALPLWFIFTQIPYLFWRRMAGVFFIGSIGLLLLLFVGGLTTDYGTSNSWLAIPFFNSFQPGELAKVGLILYFARWLERRRDELQTLESGFWPFLSILGAVVLPLALQPDFGGVMVVTLIASAIFFVAGGRAKHLLATALAGLTLVAVVLGSLNCPPPKPDEHRNTLCYVHDRFTAFLDPSVDPEGIGFQVKQSLIAVGKGGFFGQGMEGATQRFGYLPEAQSDSIFAATSEAFGLLGSIILSGMYLLIAYRGYRIAAHAPDRFGQLAAVGLATALAGQAFVHIGVNLALLPLTGITLPFVSYGGSSMLVSFLMSGILLNISKASHVHAVTPARHQ